MLYACTEWRYIALVNPGKYAENLYYSQRLETMQKTAARSGQTISPQHVTMGAPAEGTLRHLGKLGWHQDVYTRGEGKGCPAQTANRDLVKSMYS
jgi:hypothetical protein